MRIGVLALIIAAVAASIVSLIEAGPSYRVAAVIATSLALAGHAAYIAYGFEGRVYAHRACALKLWLICERQRALLAEIQDGLLDQSAILRRRDELTRDTHSAYDQTFPLDESGYESVRQWAGDNAVQAADAGVH